MSGRVLPAFRLGDRFVDERGGLTRAALFFLDALREVAGGDAATTGETAVTMASAAPVLSIGAAFGREDVAPFLSDGRDEIVAPVACGFKAMGCEPLPISQVPEMATPLPMPVHVEDTAAGGFLFI